MGRKALVLRLNKARFYVILLLICTMIVPVTGSISAHAEDGQRRIVQVETGSNFTAALYSDGTLAVWGHGGLGILANGNQKVGYNDRVGDSNEWAQISAGIDHIIAIKKDGSLWGWGFNDVSQLGTADNSMFVHQPAQIGSNRKWRSVSTDHGHSAAIAADGTLWTWGSNWAGQLGIGTKENKKTPVQVGKDRDWIQVYTGAEHTMAVKKDGTVYTWGAGTAGRLGNGKTGNQLKPMAIGALDWSSVSVGNGHTLFIKKDGSLWGWGGNDEGQLGNGATKHLAAPAQIGKAKDWVAVSAGQGTSYGLKKDGTLWTWGKVSTLGGAGKMNATTPIQIGSDRDWSYLSNVSTDSDSHMLAVKKDGSLWGWGSNRSGEIKRGTADAGPLLIPINTAPSAP